MMYEINVIKCKLDLNTKQILQYHDKVIVRLLKIEKCITVLAVPYPVLSSQRAIMYMFVFENYHLWRNTIKFVTNKQTQSAPQNDHPPKLTMISYVPVN